ncbi:T9SS type A sorting domain-containing protein [Haliscomenobacter sp.]|uniref:T9SS type A sorting domain-containing protein n=1 Tax=Haliscomenobacter sp. TaxID=2717303 RepID=UPI003593B997
MKNLFYIIFLLLIQHLTAQTPRQVLDLIPGTTSTFNDAQDELKIGVGNRVLFVIYRQFKYELWSSDGSEAGTTMLMIGKNGEDYPEFLPYDSKQVLFIADRTTGNPGPRPSAEVWITDGTAANTRKLFSNTNRFIRKLVVHQGQIFYVSASATEFFDQTELWRYNPTTSENQMLARYKGPNGIKDLIAFNDQLILLAQSKDSTYQLIKSDGTAGGTQAYHTLKNDGDLGGSPFLTATKQQVFFFFRYTKHDELYRTDGTTAGTLRLATYETINSGEVSRREREFLAWNNLFFYSACALGTSFCAQEDFFVSDGTVAGTKQLDFNDRSKEDVNYLTPYRNQLFFHPNQPPGVATTDGTLAGTRFPIVDNRSTNAIYGGEYLCVWQDSLYYPGYRAGGGDELYQSDGTAAGTRFIDLRPGSSSSEPEQLTPAGNRLFFTANTSATGRELWVYEMVSTTTGIRNAEALPAELQLWPNPASTNLELQVKAAVDLAQIRVYDLLGRTRFQTPISGQVISTSIDVSTWPKGIYLLELLAKNGTSKTEKFLIH